MKKEVLKNAIIVVISVILCVVLSAVIIYYAQWYYFAFEIIFISLFKDFLKKMEKNYIE